jgi:hypothetical protein
MSQPLSTSTWRLRRDERPAEQATRELGRGLGRAHDLDAAALTAPAGMDLRLHHDRPAEAARDLGNLLRRSRDTTLEHGDAVLLENFLRLKLVDVHPALSTRSIACTSSST